MLDSFGSIENQIFENKNIFNKKRRAERLTMTQRATCTIMLPSGILLTYKDRPAKNTMIETIIKRAGTPNAIEKQLVSPKQ